MKESGQLENARMPFANAPALGPWQALTVPDSLTPWTVVAGLPALLPQIVLAAMAPSLTPQPAATTW